MNFKAAWHGFVGPPPKSVKEYAQDVASAYDALHAGQQAVLMVDYPQLVLALEFLASHLRRTEQEQ
jgi:hypothetical protein